MYSSRKLVTDAIRVCKAHCPTLLHEVLDNFGPRSAAGGTATLPADTLKDIIDTAKAYEESGVYDRAIETYLRAERDMSKDLDVLEDLWGRAVRLAMTQPSVKSRYHEVVLIVAKRLEGIDRLEAAGDLYESVEKGKEAVRCYLAVELWDKASRVAANSPQLTALVDQGRKSALLSKQDGEGLIQHGEVTSALEVYARSGQWDACLQHADAHAPRLLPHYLLQYVKVLVKQGECLKAAEHLVTYGAPEDPANFTIYRMIVQDVMSARDADKRQPIVRDLLQRLIAPSPPYTSLAHAEDRGLVSQEFFKTLAVAYYSSLAVLAEEKGRSELCAKQAVSILRYCTECAVDKAFYLAGVRCRNVGWLNMAFFLLNRYLDIADAIDDPESATIDNADFADTDLPAPSDLQLPRSHYQGSDKIEEVRDMVLSWSVDPLVSQSLNTRKCDKCRNDIYEASLICTKCQLTYQPCVVTGYPVLRAQRIECPTCGSAANRADWATYVADFSQCPWCRTPQSA